MEINKEHGPKASGCVTKKLISFEEMPALYNIQKCLRIIFHLNNYLHLYIRRDGRHVGTNKNTSTRITGKDFQTLPRNKSTGKK